MVAVATTVATMTEAWTAPQVERAEPRLILGQGAGGSAVPPVAAWSGAAHDREYARHNGHADLIRERIDGVTGD